MKYSQYLNKLTKYCDFADRCEFDVTSKMNKLGIPLDYQAQIIKHLKENDFVNEHRFAKEFVQGKFNQNGWGKKKIIAGLRAKRVKQEYIETAIETIKDEDYFNFAHDILKKKLESLRKEGVLNLKQRAFSFLYTRGYETEIISKLLKIEKFIS